ncbi:hypothetical protein A9G41_06640 [Gilliamella sp. Nev5-1]|nr:hypothetical protein A9G30_07620 [Gilliamella apicola]OCG69102.1 hypothetical protein A9G41_06640 [Gilliamella apicola]
MQLKNYRIVYCVFPKQNFTLRFNNAQKTIGYEVASDFELTYHINWLNHLFVGKPELYKKAKHHIQNSF